jgi:hypothetical protein
MTDEDDTGHTHYEDDTGHTHYEADTGHTHYEADTGIRIMRLILAVFKA